jgi:hypothetical protein
MRVSSPLGDDSPVDADWFHENQLLNSGFSFNQENVAAHSRQAALFAEAESAGLHTAGECSWSHTYGE